VTVTRKLNLDVRIARRKLELFAEFDVFSPDLGDILAAIDLQRLHNFSFSDALILRAAKQAGCTVLSRKISKQLGNSTAFGLWTHSHDSGSLCESNTYVLFAEHVKRSGTKVGRMLERTSPSFRRTAAECFARGR
jgi:hypothetical protein